MENLKISKAEFLENASKFYEQLNMNLDDKVQDFYEYESKFDELFTNFAKESLEGMLSDLPTNIRKKKSSNPIRSSDNSGEASL
jgi:hypothetical protein